MRTLVLLASVALAACTASIVTKSEAPATHTAPPPPVASGIAASSHSDADVKLVQEKLGVPADGVWGSRSAAAMSKYQRDNGLPVTGLADNATLVQMGLAEPVESPALASRHADVVTTDAEAMSAMTSAGYTNITNLVHRGHVWRADAVDANGVSVVIVCHARNGSVNVDTGTGTD